MNQSTFAAKRHAITQWTGAANVLAFSATLFLSATLLFSLQPMFTRMVLPALGGSPAVWAVSTCFFQAVLLAGYCYAHLLNSYVRFPLAPALHVAVLGLAYSVLPVGVPLDAVEPPPGNEYMWLIGVLAQGVGLPFFAVSASAPLLQAWYTRSDSEGAQDPYFLYGASNVGSLLALLSYPFVLEPMIGLSDQSVVWTTGFVVLALMVAGCGFLTLKAMRGTSQMWHERAPATSTAPPTTWRQRLHWIACAFIPSGLLVAFTSYITTDLASAPFLWVIPLAIFLATFIVVFRERELIPHAVLVEKLPLATTALVVLLATGVIIPLPILFALSLASFVVASLVCHRELYLARPNAQHLTEFYLWMSFGGALGGLFAAIIAPQLFVTVFEFPLLALAALLLSPLVINATMTKEDWQAGLKMAACVVAIIAIANAAIASGIVGFSRMLQAVIMMSLLAVVAWQRHPRLHVASLAVILLVAPFAPDDKSVQHATRSFFGSLRVASFDNGAVRGFLHGTTLHGGQRLIDKDGAPIDRPVPALYYNAEGPLARGVDIARAASEKEAHQFRAGVVGLGVGSMACHAQPQETWRFYEIDPAVVAVARDSSKFTFLSKCQPNADIVVGDARLTLAKEAQRSFDFLLLDAFSSDSVPTHLLTIEAIAMYLEKLTPNGVLTMHVSNRHLDLVPVVQAAVKSMPGYTTIVVDDTRPFTFDTSPTSAVHIVREGHAAEALALPFASQTKETSVRAWTDDYADVISALWRKTRRH